MSFLLKKKFKKKTLEQNLCSIFGIGKVTAQKICKNLGFLPNFNFIKLREEQLNTLLNYVEQHYQPIENNLKYNLKENHSFLALVKNRRSLRNKIGLPSRGQRTHTNGNTKKKLKNG